MEPLTIVLALVGIGIGFGGGTIVNQKRVGSAEEAAEKELKKARKEAEKQLEEARAEATKLAEDARKEDQARRKEYKDIAKIPNADQFYKEERICDKSILFPSNYGAMNMSVGKAGIPTLLSELILEKSGFVAKTGAMRLS